VGPVRLRKIFSHGNGVYQQRDLPMNLNIGIEKCDLLVCALEWQGLSLRQCRRSSSALLCRLAGILARTFQGGVSRIQLLHQDLVTTHLDLDNALQLKNTSPSIDINILLRVDRLIKEDAGPSTKLAIWYNVDKYRLLTAREAAIWYNVDKYRLLIAREAGVNDLGLGFGGIHDGADAIFQLGRNSARQG
jgi:hypothetical protein